MAQARASPEVWIPRPATAAALRSRFRCALTRPPPRLATPGQVHAMLQIRGLAFDVRNGFLIKQARASLGPAVQCGLSFVPRLAAGLCTQRRRGIRLFWPATSLVQGNSRCAPPSTHTNTHVHTHTPCPPTTTPPGKCVVRAIAVVRRPHNGARWACAGRAHGCRRITASTSRARTTSTCG